MQGKVTCPVCGSKAKYEEINLDGYGSTVLESSVVCSCGYNEFFAYGSTETSIEAPGYIAKGSHHYSDSHGPFHPYLEHQVVEMMKELRDRKSPQNLSPENKTVFGDLDRLKKIKRIARECPPRER